MKTAPNDFFFSPPKKSPAQRVHDFSKDWVGHGDAPLANCPFSCDIPPWVPEGFSMSPQSSCLRAVPATVEKCPDGRGPPRMGPLKRHPRSRHAPICAAHQHRPWCHQPPWGPLMLQWSWKPKAGIPDSADLSPNS